MEKRRVGWVWICIATVAMGWLGCGADVKTPPRDLDAAPVPRAVAYDMVDGWVTATTRLVRSAGPEGVESFPLRQAPPRNVEWQVVSGEVDIVRDPFSDETLFRPRGRVPVQVRPLVDGVAGDILDIGLPGNVLPAGETVFQAAGGGACAANPNHAGMLALVGEEFEVDVRSVVATTVQPLSAGERTLVYQHAQYHAWSPQAGPMRIRFNPDFVSRTTLRSKQDPASPQDPFFPATAQTDLYFIIDFLDHGLSVFNKEPMRLRSQHTPWPPFRTPQVNEEGDVTRFYSLDDPDVLMLTIRSQEQYVYPTQELAIEPAPFTIDDNGLLRTSFEIVNQSEKAGRIRWFVLGDYGNPETPREGYLEMGPGERQRLELVSRLEKRLLPQAITFGAVSESEDRLTGMERVEFLHPRETPLRGELLRR